jgi:hypothetical protein
MPWYSTPPAWNLNGLAPLAVMTYSDAQRICPGKERLVQRAEDMRALLRCTIDPRSRQAIEAEITALQVWVGQPGRLSQIRI